MFGNIRIPNVIKHFVYVYVRVGIPCVRYSCLIGEDADAIGYRKCRPDSFESQGLTTRETNYLGHDTVIRNGPGDPSSQ